MPRAINTTVGMPSSEEIAELSREADRFPIAAIRLAESYTFAGTASRTRSRARLRSA